MDGNDRGGSDTDEILSRSRNGKQASTTRSTGVGELSKKSNNSFGSSEVDKDKKDNSGSLVQEGRQGLQLSEPRGLEQNKTTPIRGEVRQGVDDSGSDRVVICERELVNTKGKSGNKTSKQESSIGSEWISRIYAGNGCWGTESRVDWSKAESRMGKQTYGLPRWVAELGLSNSWGISDNWEDNIERVRIRQDKDIDRLKALGNAVVPQFIELTGRLIIKSIIEDTLVFDSSFMEDHQ